MAPFIGYQDDPETGTTTFQHADGTTTAPLPSALPSVYLQRRGVDQRLAVNDQGTSGPSMGDDQPPAPAPVRTDANVGGYSGGPGFTAPVASSEADVPGGATGPDLSGAGGHGQAEARYRAAVEAGTAPPLDNPNAGVTADTGGARGAGAATSTMPVQGVTPETANAAASAGKAGPVKTVPFAKPGAPKGGGGGGGGRPAGPTEMLAARTVQVQGGMSPERMAEQEAILKRKEGLDQTGLQRDLDRKNLTVEQGEQAEKLGARYDADAATMRAANQREQEEIGARREALRAKIAEGVDEGKFWKTRSTGQTIAAALALSLGGLGAALQAKAGRPSTNVGLDSINRAIDRDLELQEKELGSKRAQLGELGLYLADRKKAGDDMVAARLEAKAAALEKVKRQVERLATVTGSADALQASERVKLATDAQIAELHAKADGQRAETRQYKTMMPGGGGPARKPQGTVQVLRRGPNGELVRSEVALKPGLSAEEQKVARQRIGANNLWIKGTMELERLHGVGAADSDYVIAARSAVLDSDAAQGQGQSSDGAIKQKIEMTRGLGGNKAILADREAAYRNSEELEAQYTDAGDK